MSELARQEEIVGAFLDAFPDTAAAPQPGETNSQDTPAPNNDPSESYYLATDPGTGQKSWQVIK